MFYFGPNGPVVERDPEVQRLRDNVLSRIQDIVEKESPTIASSPDLIKFVSYEEALKELVAFKNSGSFNF